MRQSVLNPASERPATSAPAQTQPTTATPQTSVNEVPPAIIELANNRDLSIETIAREANRIQQENKLSDEEVVISLR